MKLIIDLIAIHTSFRRLSIGLFNQSKISNVFSKNDNEMTIQIRVKEGETHFPDLRYDD